MTPLEEENERLQETLWLANEELQRRQATIQRVERQLRQLARDIEQGVEETTDG